MSDTTPGTDAPVAGRLRELATYSQYADAERAVDYLSDAKFPVEFVQIVGHGITTVEQVTGRMTKGRAALYGAAGGAWFGLFLGLLFGIFANFAAVWIGLLFAGLLIGAFWGAVFGFFGQAMTGGRRDFASSKTLAADKYSVMVEETHYTEAGRLLADFR